MASALDFNDRVSRLGIGNIKKHIFICAGEKCCSASLGESSWSWLKNWSRTEAAAAAKVYRTKCKCLRVCREGPVAIVYPEGTWYRNVTPEVCERIVKEHIVGGKIVEDHIFATNPLS